MWRVMQVTETGEEFCVKDNLTLDEAEDFIEEHEENYPESSFYTEKM